MKADLSESEQGRQVSHELSAELCVNFQYLFFSAAFTPFLKQYGIAPRAIISLSVWCAVAVTTNPEEPKKC